MSKKNFLWAVLLGVSVVGGCVNKWEEKGVLLYPNQAPPEVTEYVREAFPNSKLVEVREKTRDGSWEAKNRFYELHIEKPNGEREVILYNPGKTGVK